MTFGRDPVALHKALQQAGLSEDRGLTCDVSNPADVEQVFKTMDAQMGGIDALITCAAVGAEAIFEMEDSDWRYAVETNLLGPLACARAAVQRMLPQGAGDIILLSSISPDIKAPGESVYAATKAGIDTFALTLRKEVGCGGVRVSVIQPGSVASDMQTCSAEEQRKAVSQAEMLNADEVAQAIVFVLSRPPGCVIPVMRIEPIRQKMH